MSKPFDLKAALSGEPVLAGGEPFYFSQIVRRDGIMLQFTHHNDYSRWVRTDLDGVNTAYGPLVMAPKKVKKTVYVNIDKSDGQARVYSSLYFSEEEASRIGVAVGSERLRTAFPVEIEVEE